LYRQVSQFINEDIGLRHKFNSVEIYTFSDHHYVYLPETGSQRKKGYLHQNKLNRNTNSPADDDVNCDASVKTWLLATRGQR